MDCVDGCLRVGGEKETKNNGEYGKTRSCRQRVCPCVSKPKTFGRKLTGFSLARFFVSPRKQ